MRSRPYISHDRIKHKYNQCPRGVKVTVKYQGEILKLFFDNDISVDEILNKLKIPSSTVLAIYGDKIVPHTTVISGDIDLELIVVSSGG